jgi:hypothetical protein
MASLSGNPHIQRNSRLHWTCTIREKDEVKKGKLPETVRIAKTYLFSELAGEYLRFAERQRGFRQKKSVIEQLTKTFVPLPLRRFSTMLVEQYQTERLNTGKKPATINRHLATLKHMFTKAVDWNMVESEILKRVRKVRLIPENNRRLRYLSKEECKALVNSCDVHLKPIVTMALNTGMEER